MNSDFARCPTCLEDYDENGRRPCVGFCGHSICLKCQARVVSCPLCKRKNAFFGTVINYQLLDSVLAMRQLRNEARSPSVSRGKKTSEPNISQQVVNATRRSRRNALESVVDKTQQREMENNWLSQHIPQDARHRRERSLRRLSERLVIEPLGESYQWPQNDNYRFLMLRSQAPGIHGFLNSPFTRLFFGRSCFEI